MSVFERFGRAAAQVQEMATQLGVDELRPLDATPDLEAQRLRSRVFRCAYCEKHEDCASKLAAGGLTAAPDYCRNKGEFDLAGSFAKI